MDEIDELDKFDKFEFSTKYFGKIIIDVDDNGDGDTYVDFNGQEIGIFLHKYNTYGDKVKMCLEIIDKYVEIDKMVRKAITEYFITDKTVRYYFKYHFEMWGKEQLIKTFGTNIFRKMDIGNAVEKFRYPNLFFSMEKGEITFNLCYMISKEYSDEILTVMMDEKLNIKDFLHES